MPSSAWKRKPLAGSRVTHGGRITSPGGDTDAEGSRCSAHVEGHGAPTPQYRGCCSSCTVPSTGTHSSPLATILCRLLPEAQHPIPASCKHATLDGAIRPPPPYPSSVPIQIAIPLPICSGLPSFLLFFLKTPPPSDFPPFNRRDAFQF